MGSVINGVRINGRINGVNKWGQGKNEFEIYSYSDPYIYMLIQNRLK
jgi:hypothetical protein